MVVRKSAAKKAAAKKLTRYQSMRDFQKTKEPSGAGRGAKAGVPANGFVVQKHAATRLHYDFRLALNGVLKSWAVTKGPSLDPHDKRLAVEVEDHPIGYGTFEGTIPKGQYGGGTVMLWDRGTWEPVEPGDPEEQLRKGHLKFQMHGQRMRGRWVLVRMGGKAASEKRANWLLIKERDEFVREGGTPLIEAFTDSVSTGRAMEQIAGAEDSVWQSGKAARPATVPARPKIVGGKKAKLPDFVPPQLATRVAAPPRGDDWLHEIKFDGYRTLLRLDGGKVQFLTRTGLDWTKRFEALAPAAKSVRALSAMIDGEIVVLNDSGVSDFGALQATLSGDAKGQLIFYAFDLLHLDGQDLTTLPLVKRKAALMAILPAGDEHLRYSDHVEASGDGFYAQACQMALEGIISKRRDAPYRKGRGDGWQKSKCVERQEFVVGGWIKPTDKSPGVGSLLVGYFQDGKFVYAGKVGTGYSQKAGLDLRDRLKKLTRATHPFSAKPADSRDALWVDLRLVVEIEYLTWTRDGLLRHASFKGVREDKEARTVTIEKVAGAPAPAKAAAKSAAVKSADAEIIAGVRITHPDRRIDEESGLTKRGLAEYLELVADRMLPHVAGRPLSVVRCPDGSGKACFYQKHVGRGMPDGVHATPIPEKGGGTSDYLTVDTVQGLIGLAQMGVLEFHPWGARSDDVELPDRIIWDFDPDPDLPYARVIEGALNLRRRLQDLGLESFVKTTGGKGLHVVVPIQRKHPWPVIKAFARAVAEAMAKDDPVFLTKMTKAARKGKIFLDFFRNDRGATAIAPYSTRSRPGAPIACPLEWSELKPSLLPSHFNVENLPRRLAKLKADPWAPMLKSRQGLTAKALAAMKVKA